MNSIPDFLTLFLVLLALALVLLVVIVLVSWTLDQERFMYDLGYVRKQREEELIRIERSQRARIASLEKELHDLKRFLEEGL